MTLDNVRGNVSQGAQSVASTRIEVAGRASDKVTSVAYRSLSMSQAATQAGVSRPTLSAGFAATAARRAA